MVDSLYTDIKVTWPKYQDMPIKSIEDIAKAFCEFLKSALNLDGEYSLTAEGIIITVVSKQLSDALDAIDASGGVE
jgi:hypothetical protein